MFTISVLLLSVVSGTFAGMPGAVTMLNTTGVTIYGDSYITQPIAWERPPGHVGTVEYVITYTEYVYKFIHTLGYYWVTYSMAAAATNQTSFDLSLETPTRGPIAIHVYTVSVAARSTAGQGEAVQMNITYTGPGSPVNIQTHNITCNSITVTWQAPVNTGGLEVGYRIEESTTNFRKEVGTNETKQIVIPNLVQSTSYSIRVIAENSISDSYESIRESTVAKVPGAVTMLRTTGVGHISYGDSIPQPIAWERPPGHVGTVEYVITYTGYVYRWLFSVYGFYWLTYSRAAAATTNQTSFDLSLAIPTGNPISIYVYTVSVAARSTAGQGEAVQMNITYTGPGSPVNIQTHNITCNSITVTWEAPVNTGGLEVGYRIEESTTNFRKEVGTNETKQIVIPNLVQSTSYRITVIAENSISEMGFASGSAEYKRESTVAKEEGELLAANITATSVTLYHILGNDVQYRCNVTTETSAYQFNITDGEGYTLSGLSLSADTTYTVNCVAYRGGAECCLEATTTFRTYCPIVRQEIRNGHISTSSTGYRIAQNFPDYEYYDPQCTPEGLFESLQCTALNMSVQVPSHSRIQCWCVDPATGIPVQDSSSYGPMNVSECGNTTRNTSALCEAQSSYPVAPGACTFIDCSIGAPAALIVDCFYPVCPGDRQPISGPGCCDYTCSEAPALINAEIVMVAVFVPVAVILIAIFVISIVVICCVVLKHKGGRVNTKPPPLATANPQYGGIQEKVDLSGLEGSP